MQYTKQLCWSNLVTGFIDYDLESSKNAISLNWTKKIPLKSKFTARYDLPSVDAVGYLLHSTLVILMLAWTANWRILELAAGSEDNLCCCRWFFCFPLCSGLYGRIGNAINADQLQCREILPTKTKEGVNQT